MPRANRAARALVTVEAMDALGLLARDGAHLAAARSPEGPGGACAIYVPDNGFAEPVSHVSRPAIAYSLRKGWLEWDGEGRCLRISAAGRGALHTKQNRAKARTKPPAARPKPPSSQPRGADQGQGRLAEGPLAKLRRRKHKDGRPVVTDAQFSAAEKLAADFWHG
jgi:hypothetical protein